jgi:hypothetical protein
MIYRIIKGLLYSLKNYYIFYTKLCDKVCEWLATGQWFSPGTHLSSTNKTDCHDITEILLKVALNTITLNTNDNIIIRVSPINNC